MTEAEWLSSDSRELMNVIKLGDDQRRLRLLAVACCRRIEHLILQQKGAWRAVILAERIADGEPVTEEARDLRGNLAEVAFSWIDGYRPEKLNNVLYNATSAAGMCLAGLGADIGMASFGKLTSTGEQAAYAAAHWERRNDNDALKNRWVDRELSAQAFLARCIFGNPFRPVSLDPAWLTSTAVSLANGIYTDRAFDRTPILADALQDAGCEDETVLTHLRHDEVHVRGCWVVDLVLGKQ